MMEKMAENKNNNLTKYYVKKEALPACCPTKDMPLWSKHPRVYLPLDEKHRNVVCPYCDNRFILVD